MGRKVERECPVCGAAYEADQTRLDHGRQTTCSRACSYRRRADAGRLAVEVSCSTCGNKFSRVPSHRKSRHDGEYCSRKCHYAGRGLGHTKRIVEEYNLTPAARSSMSARACRDYAAGRTFPIPETEIRVSAALGALGIGHVHQHVIDLDGRSVAVDLFFPGRMLVIEIDEPSLHRKYKAKDDQRDLELAEAGYTVKRVRDDRDTLAITARVLRALA